IRSARINAPNWCMVNAGPLPPESLTRGLRGTAFYDAVWVACTEKLATEAGRKALVIITDADDQGSKVELKEAIEVAERTDAVIHILLVHDPGYGTRPDVAKKIAEETGGRVIDVGSMKHLQEAFDQIAEELRDQYTLGYYPTNPAHDGKFRKIKVETADQELKDIAGRVFVKHARPGAFLAGELLHSVVVVDFAFSQLILLHRHLVVIVEFAAVRRHPMEPPAHPLLERFDLRQRRPRDDRQPDVARRKVHNASVNMIRDERAAWAAFRPPWTQHEVIHDQLV